MKKLLIVIGLMVALTPTFGQLIYSTNNLTAGTHTLGTDTKIAYSVFVSTTNTTAPTVIRIYDGFHVNTNAAYSAPLSYTTNIVTSYITTLGTTNLHTNRLRFNTTQTIAANTNVANPPVWAFTVPPNSTATFEPDTSHMFVRFMNLSNNLTGASVVVSYRNP